MDTNNNQRSSEENNQNKNQNGNNQQNAAERENQSPAFDSQHSGDSNGGMDPGAIPETGEDAAQRRED